MNLHEYQSKDILKEYGIKIPKYMVAKTLDEALNAYDSMGLVTAVVKVQVHAGGRGKAGGVKLVKNRAEFKEKAQALLGMKICNNQTGPEGVIAHQILISDPVDIAKEYYISAIINREKGEPVIIFSPEGGMDIEEVAHHHPHKLFEIPFTSKGVIDEKHLSIFDRKETELDAKGATELKKIAKSLAKLFVEKDASMVEINPLVLTKQGEIVAVDGKIGIDDNALFRHPDLSGMYDPTQQTESEVAAHEHDLVYIALDGNIGCLVNGAGLAMSTMDIIAFYGGKPANFLDVGGSATKEKVTEAFKIILHDPKVKAILVNIFGGIMSCRTIAEGVIAAAKQLSLKVPLVVRLEGSEVEMGKKLLKESGLNIISADSLDDAAKKSVATLKR